MHVVLAQLPAPGPHNWGNVPLAAAYLKAMVIRAALPVEVDVLERPILSGAGDEGLVNEIVSRKPDVLGLSFYSWNGLRSLHLARRVKASCPDLIVVVGGRDVQPESTYIYDRAVDVGVVGPGEYVFPMILSRLLRGSRRFDDIRGIWYWKNGDIVHTQPQDPFVDLASLPSPYLEHTFDIEAYPTWWFEASRGCPRRCTFCQERGTMTRAGFDRIEREMALAVEHKKDVVFIDPNFVLSPILKEICLRIARINQKKVSLSGAFEAEAVNDEVARHLALANFTLVEIGLQSVNARTLKAIERRFVRDRFLAGVQHLRRHGIRCIVDVIFGLPGETITDMEATLTFLEEHNLLTDVAAFRLCVLPGTDLRRHADDLKLVYDPLPPYELLHNSIATSEEVDSILNTCRHRQQAAHGTGHTRPLNLTGMSHLIVGPGNSTPCRSGHSRPCTRTNFAPVTALHIDGVNLVHGDIADIAARLAHNLLLCVHANRATDFRHALSLVTALRSRNPFTEWDLVIDASRIQAQKDFIVAALAFVAEGFDRALLKRKVWISSSTELGWPDGFLHGIGLTLTSSDTSFLEMLTAVESWGSVVDRLVLVDFDAALSPQAVAKVVRAVGASPFKERIFFRNFALEVAMGRGAEVNILVADGSGTRDITCTARDSTARACAKLWQEFLVGCNE